MSDLIDRHAAIDALAELPYGIRGMVKGIIAGVPSAQPDIIRCKDCKHCQIDNVYHDYWCDGRKVWKDHYCGYAERRSDE